MSIKKVPASAQTPPAAWQDGASAAPRKQWPPEPAVHPRESAPGAALPTPHTRRPLPPGCRGTRGSESTGSWRFRSLGKNIRLRNTRPRWDNYRGRVECAVGSTLATTKQLPPHSGERQGKPSASPCSPYRAARDATSEGRP